MTVEEGWASVGVGRRMVEAGDGVEGSRRTEWREKGRRRLVIGDRRRGLGLGRSGEGEKAAPASILVLLLKCFQPLHSRP